MNHQEAGVIPTRFTVSLPQLGPSSRICPNHTQGLPGEVCTAEMKMLILQATAAALSSGRRESLAAVPSSRTSRV